MKTSKSAPHSTSAKYTFENPTGAALAVRDRSFVVDRIGDGDFVLLK